MSNRDELGAVSPTSSSERETGRPMRIREMDPGDLEAVLSMERSSSLTPWSWRMFMGELTNPLASCIVLTDEGQSPPALVGFLCFRSVRNESELLNLCAHSLYRRRGVGRKLMQCYMERCAAMGIETCYLEVSVSNEEALRLYRSFSYEVVGRRKKFYRGEFDALLMVKKI